MLESKQLAAQRGAATLFSGIDFRLVLVQTAPQPPHRELLLSEYRPGPMRWAVLTPRPAPPS